MERFELGEELKAELRAGVASEKFMKLVQSLRRNGKHFKIALRPIQLGGERRYQAEMTDDGQVQVKNFTAESLQSGLEEILNQKGARELHLLMADGDVHVRVTRKGRVTVSRSAAQARTVVLEGHDRVKRVPLNAFDSAALLKAIGLTDGEGRIRASMRGKYDQVNEFLRVVGETVARPAPGETAVFTAVDCGCGKAYLTVSLWYYLTQVLGFAAVKVVGVDRRDDVIAAAEAIARTLAIEEHVQFVQCDLTELELAAAGIDHVDLVCSLHACDTATDEALARAVEWKARYVLSAPCCQHELQKTVGVRDAERGMRSRAFAGLLRQGILKERLCDLLTDAFRALILRILGYRVQVIEFVSSEATARNVMLKGEYSVKPGQAGPIGEYLELRDFWRVEPFLETRLKERLERHLGRFEGGECSCRGGLRG